MCKKAGRSVCNFVLFQSFIMSHFNYCPCVWHFARRNDVRKVENVQYRSLKHVFNDFKSPHGELKKRTYRLVMYVQRLRAILIEVYNAYFDIGSKYTCDIFTKSNQVYSTRNDKMLVQPKCFNFSHGIYSFRYEGTIKAAVEVVGSRF